MDLAKYASKGYSQFTEDGILLELLCRIPHEKYFVEIGAGNGEENCTRVLAEMGWDGLWIDADPCNIQTARKIAAACPGRVDVAWVQVTAENVLETVGGRDKWNVWRKPDSIGVMSIDVDGNDYYIWQALAWYKPAIVVIEAQIQRPFDTSWVMDYDPYYLWPHGDNDCGASVASLIELGDKQGYWFVGKCPDYHSPNLFFVAKKYALQVG